MSDNRLDDISLKIEKLSNEIVEIKTLVKTFIASQEKECSFRRIEIDSIKKVIEGNGKKGLKDRLDELEKFEVKVISYATVIFSVINFIIIRLLK